MLVTKREQEIINEIVKKGKVSITELLEVVGVSRRTLYRDLQNLQQFLPKYQVNLIKIAVLLTCSVRRNVIFWSLFY